MRNSKTMFISLLAAALLVAAGCDGATDSDGAPGDGSGVVADGESCASHSVCGAGSACLTGACASLDAHLDAASGCSDNADCLTGELCQDGYCVAATDGDVLDCAANADCPAWSICLDGLCVVLADADGDGFRAPEDCDDLNGAVHPAAVEVANGLDDDCDGEVDEGVGEAPECTEDLDCARAERCQNGVCVRANDPRQEICNGLDDDGDGVIDEGCDERCASDSDCAAGQTCDAATGSCVPLGCRSDAECARGEVCVNGACVPDGDQPCRTHQDCARGMVCVNGVCVDDSDPDDDTDDDGVADDLDNCPEMPNPDQLDSDADGVGDACDVDGDDDGYPLGVDCDDTDPSVNPGAVEIAANGRDDDCDGLVDEGDQPCRTHQDCARGMVCVNGVCVDDSDPDDDMDGDGFPAGIDCDDADPTVHPAAVELPGNGRDDDCDGEVDEGALPCTHYAECPRGTICLDGLCLAPEEEICGDGLDNDYDGLIDEGCGDDYCRTDDDCATGQVCDLTTGLCVDPQPFDADGDGFPAGRDCDDHDPSINPAAPELPGNGLDDDCDGLIDEGDAACTSDADCARGELCMDGLCVMPLPEICDGLDNDYDGLIDEGCGELPCAADADCPAGMVCDAATRTCVDHEPIDADGDGFPAGRDCDDYDASIFPGAPEVPNNGIDDDCDGLVDEGGMTCASDADCARGELCMAGLCVMPLPEICDGLDNDYDGVIDEGCDDYCRTDADCAAGQACDATTGMCVYPDPSDADADGDGIPDAVDVCPATPDPRQQDTDMDGVGDACDVDADNDGADAREDCNDLDPSMSPYAPEVCDGLDNDCDGVIDEGC